MTVVVAHSHLSINSEGNKNVKLILKTCDNDCGAQCPCNKFRIILHFVENKKFLDANIFCLANEYKILVYAQL